MKQYYSPESVKRNPTPRDLVLIDTVLGDFLATSAAYLDILIPTSTGQACGWSAPTLPVAGRTA